MSSISISEWEWFGNPGHWILGYRCQFHLLTVIGEKMISTVGEYIPTDFAKDGILDEMRWLQKNFPGDKVNLDDFYETMVFKVTGRCDAAECGGCKTPQYVGKCLNKNGYQTRKAAQDGHMRMCMKYAVSEGRRLKK